MDPRCPPDVRWIACVVATVGFAACRAEPPADPNGAVVPADAAATPTPTSEPTTSTPSPPLPEGPILVVHNPGEGDVDLYGAYLTDRAGTLGTLALWPHEYDCPDVVPMPHLIPGNGTGWLPAPTEAYADGCTPSPLAPGEYVLRLHSGYAESYYGAALITLPLRERVQIELKNHDAPPPCTPERARRAATLTLAAAKAEGAVPPPFERECDLSKARCGTLPLEDTMPPSTCTVTLHETLLRFERPAGTDAIRFLDAWVDDTIVFAQRPELRATSASAFLVDGKPIVLAGHTDHASHEHGGEAAKIGDATFAADNPLPHPVPLKVTKVEFLTDHSCALPWDVRAKPKVVDFDPKALPPGRSEVTVSFAAQGAYQAHCDRFATRVTFDVDGHRAPVTVEHEVMRFEPLRER